ncbi:MAG: DUF308 domain-containing protein [Bacteroidales bacterium]|nr:DUF308 domain-containing protein [Bacteroidales bacterium]
MKKVKKTKIYLAITAVLFIVLGVLFIVKPMAGIVSVAWMVGLLMLISGVCTLFFSLRHEAIMPNAGSTTLMSVLQVVLGLVFLLNRGITVATIIIMFGMWIAVEGIQLAVLSFEYKRYGMKGWWLMTLLGGCSVVLGVYALLHPVATSATISVLVGIAVIANGISRLVAFSGISKVQKKVEGAKERMDNFLKEYKD